MLCLFALYITLGTSTYELIYCCSTEKSRLTVGNREAKKKQHACAPSGLHDYCSELLTWMAALTFKIM